MPSELISIIENMIVRCKKNSCWGKKKKNRLNTLQQGGSMTLRMTPEWPNVPIIPNQHHCVEGRRAGRLAKMNEMKDQMIN